MKLARLPIGLELKASQGDGGLWDFYYAETFDEKDREAFEKVVKISPYLSLIHI